MLEIHRVFLIQSNKISSKDYRSVINDALFIKHVFQDKWFCCVHFVFIGVICILFLETF